MTKKTEDRFIDSRMLKTLRSDCKNVESLLLDTEMWSKLNPITPARVADEARVETKGYFATNDGRVALRLVPNQEAQDLFGVDSITLKEAWYLSFRLGEIGAMEVAALNAQRENVLLRRSLVACFDAARGLKVLTKGDAVAASTILRETDPNKPNEDQ